MEDKEQAIDHHDLAIKEGVRAFAFNDPIKNQLDILLGMRFMALKALDTCSYGSVAYYKANGYYNSIEKHIKQLLYLD